MDGRLDLTRARREAKALLAAARGARRRAPGSARRRSSATRSSPWRATGASAAGPRWCAAPRPKAAARPTPLARAAGDAERTARLLAAGADPRDEEAVRRAAGADDPESLRLLLAAGATPHRTQALATVLEREDPDTVALVLDHLPEQSGERAWALLWAVQHGRSAQIVRLLVERGADLEAYDEAADRRPYGLAIRRGRPDLAELLASLGAQRRVGPVDELLGACMAGDAEQARQLAANRPEAVALIRGAYAGALAEAAAEGRVEAVRLLLELGVPPDARAESGLTPLEAAKGDPEVLALLLAHGADPAKPGTPPAVATSPLDFAELSWQAEVAYLRLLAPPPARRDTPRRRRLRRAHRRRVQHRERRRLRPRHDAQIAEAVAWLAGAPAQWFISSASALGPRLVAAGATPERTAVVMGRALDTPPPPPPDDIPIRDTLDAHVGGGASGGSLRHVVALRDGAPAGTARWMIHGDVVYGLNLEVEPTARRQGIGGALMRHGLREAYAAGARAAVLGPTPDTIAFHRLFGFELRPYLRDRSFYLP